MYMVNILHVPLEMLKTMINVEVTIGTIFILYCKNHKNSDTRKNCCNQPKIWTTWLYLGAVWTASTPFACVSENLGSLQYAIWYYQIRQDMGLLHALVIVIEQAGHDGQSSNSSSF